jgi:CDP-diacylglycerol--serine O-phosphatidyltransferase
VLSDVKGLGWLMSLMFAICMALRLARFNTVMKDDELGAEVKAGYYTGIPAPASAALAVWPMILSFEFGFEFLEDPNICSAYMAFLCLLTVSRIPTFSFKSLKIHEEHVIFVLLGIGILASLLITNLWMTMSVVGMMYLISIPTIALFSSRNKK